MWFKIGGQEVRLTEHQKGCPFEEDYTRPYNPEKVGTPEEQAKALHHYIDWLKAVKKRDPPDNRGVDTLTLLLRIQEGYRTDTEEGWDTHYRGT